MRRVIAAAGAERETGQGHIHQLGPAKSLTGTPSPDVLYSTSGTRRAALLSLFCSQTADQEACSQLQIDEVSEFRKSPRKKNGQTISINNKKIKMLFLLSIIKQGGLGLCSCHQK